VTTYPGRIEARCTVPTGGLTVSASNQGGGPTDCTVAAGNLYPTALCAALQTALNTSRAPSAGSWSVSLSSTDGRITIACDEAASIVWTSTALRDVLGFEYDFDYPKTAAHAASVIGGTWTSGAGWLCNEASGDLAPVFGAVTLADSGAPTYSTQGPRGGTDKAVGFTGVGDSFGGGDQFDVTATDDLIIAWVGRFSATPAAQTSIVGKHAPPGYVISARTDGVIRFGISDGSTALDADSTTSGTQPGEWHVGIAVIDRSTNQARVGTFGLTSQTNATGTATSTAGHGSLANGSSFQLGGTVGGFPAAPTGLKVAALYVTVGSGVATGLAANLSTVLANFAATFTTQTGTQQCRGVWIPDWPLQLDGDPEQAPTISDLRTSQSPTGVVLGLSGNTFYRHTGLVYSHVARDRVWESAATYDHASWEWFFRETQLGLESSLFTPASPLQIYWNNAGTLTLLGDAANDGAGTDGWTITGLGSVEPRPSQANYTGLFRIELGTVVSEG
jgi:hypothetical protein